MRYQYPLIRNAEDFWKAEAEVQCMEYVLTYQEAAPAVQATRADLIMAAVRLRDASKAIAKVTVAQYHDERQVALPPEYPQPT